MLRILGSKCCDRDPLVALASLELLLQLPAGLMLTELSQECWLGVAAAALRAASGDMGSSASLGGRGGRAQLSAGAREAAWQLLRGGLGAGVAGEELRQQAGTGAAQQAGQALLGLLCVPENAQMLAAAGEQLQQEFADSDQLVGC
jgi:hypothetical protein